jgi:hypothetical protein
MVNTPFGEKRECSNGSSGSTRIDLNESSAQRGVRNDKSFVVWLGVKAQRRTASGGEIVPLLVFPCQGFLSD